MVWDHAGLRWGGEFLDCFINFYESPECCEEALEVGPERAYRLFVFGFLAGFSWSVLADGGGLWGLLGALGVRGVWVCLRFPCRIVAKLQ